MASGYRYDDARPTGGTYGSSRGMDPDVTPYGRTRLSEGSGYRDPGARPLPETTGPPGGDFGYGAPEDRREPIHGDARYGAASHPGDRYRDEDFGHQNSHYQDDHHGFDQRDPGGYPERWSHDEGADYADGGRRDSAHRGPHYQETRYSDRDYPDEQRGGSADHRDSEHEAPYYGDPRYHDDYQEPGYGHRARSGYDDGAGSGRHGDRSGYRDGFDDHEGGYHRGMDDPNADYEQPEPGMETRRVSREELGLPPLRRRGGAPDNPPPADERTTVDVPVQRRDSRPAPPPAADSTVLLPRQSGRGRGSEAADPSSARTQYVPRASAGAGAIPRARTDDPSTQVIRAPEDLPRIDIPGASDDQATQLFDRPDNMGRPVFVDSSGKRGKYLRVLVQVFGVLCLIFLVGIVASLAIPSAMKATITGTQESASPSATTTASTAPTPKRSASAAVVPPAATTSSRKPSANAKVTPSTRASVSPTPTKDENDTGNLPTTIPTLAPTTPVATTADADPTADPPNNNNN